MKKPRFSLTLIILPVALLSFVLIGHLYLSRFDIINDNKSKLTLVSITQKSITKLPPLKTLIAKNIEKQNNQNTVLNETASLLTTSRSYTKEEINKMTEEQFSNLLKDTEMRLPKLTEIKKIPAEALHHIPTLIIQAGRELGIIKEVLKVHESYEKMVTPFYKTCALNNIGTTPVRALCLTNLIEIKRKNNQTLNLRDYPTKLVELSKIVTDI